MAEPLVWPVEPDWGHTVKETLEWNTDVMHSTATGKEVVRQLRNFPRRSFSFTSLVLPRRRGEMDMFIRRIGVQTFILPVFPDEQTLAQDTLSGNNEIFCRTKGYDFEEGGTLVAKIEGRWKTFGIQKVGLVKNQENVEGLKLDAILTFDMKAGTPLYPGRKAKLVDQPEVTDTTPDISEVESEVTIVEPSKWEAQWPSEATYRDLFVLEWGGAWNSPPQHGYDRDITDVDAKIGPAFYMDLPGKSYRKQSMSFFLHGRDAYDKFRSMVYKLKGRVESLWLPDWTVDLVLHKKPDDNDGSLVIEQQNYTALGGPVSQNRDLRIELKNGDILYRRVTASTSDDDTETLTLNSNLGALGAGVLRVSWMSVCVPSSDKITITYTTPADGVSHADIHWESLSDDV